MEPFTCPGTYLDDRGREEITWSFRPSEREGWDGRYEIWTEIRGVTLWGADFDGLEPESPTQAAALLPLDRAGELAACVLSGELPCLIVGAAEVPVASTVTFTLDLRGHGVVDGHLRLTCQIDGVDYSVTDSWFEDGLQWLDRSLPEGMAIRACVTCLFSDYSPGGHGVMGIRCHRGAKDHYLSVRTKTDYWSVPVTEEVPETYLCPEYQPRIPGTGYRG